MFHILSKEPIRAAKTELYKYPILSWKLTLYDDETNKIIYKEVTA